MVGLGAVGFYKKKPVVISAEGPITESCEIETLEGVMVANVGDYIITGIKGERYPCKPDIFEASYDSIGCSFREAGSGWAYEQL